jgi:hypothetical protein
MFKIHKRKVGPVINKAKLARVLDEDLELNLIAVFCTPHLKAKTHLHLSLSLVSSLFLGYLLHTAVQLLPRETPFYAYGWSYSKL